MQYIATRLPTRLGWDDEHVHGLLVSVARSFPVGAVMLLETGGEGRFQVRPLENVPFDKDKPIERHYFFNIAIALEGPERLEDALIAVELDRKLKTNFGRDVVLDLGTPELEYTNFYY